MNRTTMNRRTNFREAAFKSLGASEFLQIPLRLRFSYSDIADSCVDRSASHGFSNPLPQTQRFCEWSSNRMFGAVSNCCVIGQGGGGGRRTTKGTKSTKRRGTKVCAVCGVAGGVADTWKCRRVGWWAMDKKTTRTRYSDRVLAVRVGRLKPVLQRGAQENRGVER